MSNAFGPPPRRPAPVRLRSDLARALDRAPAGAVPLRAVVIPLVAASLVGATVFGVSSLSDRQSAPAVTASPSSSARPSSMTTLSTGTTPRDTPTPAPPSPPVSIDVRTMTPAEIAADIKSCRQRQSGPTDLPRVGRPKTLYAMTQRVAGTDGPTAKAVRVLLVQDDAGVWICENGSNSSWRRGALSTRVPTAKTPVVEVGDYGGATFSCGKNTGTVSGANLFAVGDGVAAGRIRITVENVKGPWQTSKPDHGFLNVRFGLQGADAYSRSVQADYQILDADGQALTIQPQDDHNAPATHTVQRKITTCADVVGHQPRVVPIKPPNSDGVGIKTCLAMIKESSGGKVSSNAWTTQLVVSSPAEWGAVLSAGRHRVGCSLFPTKEISGIAADAAELNRAAFFFALDPISLTNGVSLWAAGRVPTDVVKISYRLPGGHDVAAKINPGGYWMLKYSQHAALAKGAVNSWDPVVVTVTQPTSATTFSIAFNEQTMCNQVSHGC